MSASDILQDFPYDATITLLIFLIGVPALVSQSMPAEVRGAVMKRSLTLQLEALLFVSVAILVVIGGIVLRASVDPTSQFWAMTWVVMILILFVIVGVASFRAVLFYGRRDAIAKALKREVLRDLRHGRLVENSLADLIGLGIQSTPGQAKEVVLQELQDVTERLCSRPEYSGDRLETLVQGLVDMLTSDPAPWSPHNFETAAHILRRIVTAFNVADVEGGCFRDVDLTHTVHALSKLGQSALTMDNESVSMSFMLALAATGNRHQRVTTAVSQALYEVGVAALECEAMLVATAALDKLCTLVEVRAPAEGELVADTLGLLAHFWAAGDTAKGYAARKLTELSGNIKLELPMELKAAQEHYSQRMRFLTANHVNQLIQDLNVPLFSRLWTPSLSVADLA